MTWLPLIILALVQGLTEFLPISSSGHLILVHHLFNDLQNWENRLVLDIAVHVGTLFSVVLYFRKDVIKMLHGAHAIATGNTQNQGAHLVQSIIIASIPVILAGLAFRLLKPTWMLLVNVIAFTTLFFGILLWVADRMPERSKSLKLMSRKDAILIGLAQMLALVPGTSRSGITMTAARFLGYSRTESAHFSLLLAIIAITGAGVIGSIELLQSGNITLGLDALIAAIISFFSGWIAIALMMKWLEKSSFVPFAIYRIILGVALLMLANSGIF